MKVNKIQSIALTVSAIDQAQNFYTQALGFRPVDDITFEAPNYSQLTGTSDSRVRLVTLQLGDELIELVQYLDLEAKLIPADSQSNDLWFQHMAIVVSDMDRAYEHLKSFPIQPISTEPQTMPEENPLAAGVRAFKFREPCDRHSLELIWFPKEIGKDKWQRESDAVFLGIDHSAISVASTDASLKFYRDLLGMSVEGSNLNSGEVQAQLDGLPVAEVQVTPLQPAETRVGI
ncbi:MAG: VOC family protein [Microcoleaceae cyanobacterium]